MRYKTKIIIEKDKEKKGKIITGKEVVFCNWNQRMVKASLEKIFGLDKKNMPICIESNKAKLKMIL